MLGEVRRERECECVYVCVGGCVADAPCRLGTR